MTIWAAAVVASTLGGWMHQPLAPRGDVARLARAVTAYAEEAQVGNVAIALLVDGEVYSRWSHSIGEPVDASTVFQMASVSKWVTSWGVMALVEQGVIDLDAPVSRYLRRWELPESGFDNDGVTVRRLLSHTAGLTDGLGYLGFEPGQEVQGLVESLSDTADPVEAASGKVRVGRKPGSGWMYSGGGYTILQLLIEDVTGESFTGYMQRTVLDPLEMTGSSFVWDGSRSARLATSYDRDLEPAPHYRYTALAAASLYSTVNDGLRFLQAHLPGADGEPVGRGVLRPETVSQMQVPQARKLGRDIWGLGCVLYADNDEGGYVIGHDGNKSFLARESGHWQWHRGDVVRGWESGEPPRRRVDVLGDGQRRCRRAVFGGPEDGGNDRCRLDRDRGGGAVFPFSQKEDLTHPTTAAGARAPIGAPASGGVTASCRQQVQLAPTEHAE